MEEAEHENFKKWPADGVDLELTIKQISNIEKATVPLLAWRQNIQMNQSFRRFVSQIFFFQMFYK